MTITQVVAEPSLVSRLPAAGPAIRTILTNTCPPQWATYVERCGGGFFHTPAGCDGGGIPGDAFFARLVAGTQVVGVAAGVRRACRLSDTGRHVFLPTYPAVLPGVSRRTAVDALVTELRTLEAADVAMESFDAASVVEPGTVPQGSKAREEYVVPLATPTEMWGNLSSSHRRQAKRGDKSAWRFGTTAGEPARSLLIAVQQVASERATARGNGFRSHVPALTDLDFASGRPWGATMFAAWQGDTPLAAALIGWGNGRAFYIMGGSTPEGYEAGASVWLHWRIICQLAEMRFTHYNLGGASSTASQPDDPAHGLYRFKTAFGAQIVPCRSLYWTLSVPHARLHQLARWIATHPSDREA